MSGKDIMYKVKPLFNFTDPISLPKCMYKVSNIHDQDSCSSENSTSDAENQDLLQIEKKQLNVLLKLEDLKNKVMSLKNELGLKQEAEVDKFYDIVIKANPRNPPLSLWVFYYLLSETRPSRIVTYLHSSLKELPSGVKNLKNLSHGQSSKVSLSVVWREGEKDHEMMVDPINQGLVEGEVNIARYLSRYLSFNYEDDPLAATLMDNWLELAHASILHGTNKDRQAALKCLNSHLGKAEHLVGDSLCVADIVVWSALIQVQLNLALPANVGKWFNSLLTNNVFRNVYNLIQCA